MATSALTDKTPANRRIRRGAIIRVMQEGNGWAIIQLPEVESAFVSASAEDGAIRALVGGFDFNRNKFNHVTQAWRQPTPPSNHLFIQRHWKRDSHQAPSLMTRRLLTTHHKRVVKRGNPKITTTNMKVRCRCAKAYQSRRT